MNLRFTAALLSAAAVFHRTPELKAQLREVAGELEALADAPVGQPASRRKSA